MSFLKRQNNPKVIINTEMFNNNYFFQKLKEDIPKPKIDKTKNNFYNINLTTNNIINNNTNNNNNIINTNKSQYYNNIYQLKENYLQKKEKSEKILIKNILKIPLNNNISKKRNLKNNESSISNSTNSTTINLNPSISERYIIKIPKIFSKKQIRNNSFSAVKKNNEILSVKDNEINLEDLLLIEEKFTQLKMNFSYKNLNYQILLIQIYEWWNFYFNCSLNGYIEKYFIEKNSKQIIHFYNIIQFVFIMILYELCFFPNLIVRNKNKIKSVLILLQKNLLLIIDFILQKIDYQFTNNLWVEKIFFLLKNKFSINIQDHIIQIQNNNQIIYNIINEILIIIQVISDLKNYNSLILLYDIFYNKSEKEILSFTNENINNIFFNKIYKCFNPNSSLVPANIKYHINNNNYLDDNKNYSPSNKIINTIYSNKKKKLLKAKSNTFLKNIFSINDNNHNKILYDNKTNSNKTLSDSKNYSDKNYYSENNNNNSLNNILTNNNNILNNMIYYKIKNYSVDNLNNNKNTNLQNKNVQNLKNINSIYQKITVEQKKILTIPFIKTPSLKKLTLILDLDETIINFKITNIKINEGKLLLRPYLKDFLKEISKLYEIILFTAAIKDYAEPIINLIEKEEKFFSFKFYREHTIIINNFFVKDISLIGRDIDKIIIVDNLPQNFMLQKENGILIKSFYGENKEDNSLFHLLKILIRIYNENDDVRNSIKKYKNEILRKVTSSIDIEKDL